MSMHLKLIPLSLLYSNSQTFLDLLLPASVETGYSCVSIKRLQWHHIPIPPDLWLKCGQRFPDLFFLIPRTDIHLYWPHHGLNKKKYRFDYCNIKLNVFVYNDHLTINTWRYISWYFAVLIFPSTPSSRAAQCFSPQYHNSVVVIPGPLKYEKNSDASYTLI